MVMKTAFPSPTGVAISSVDVRADLAGLVVRNTAGVPRAGVLPRSTAALVTSRATMGVDVGAFEAVLVRNGFPGFAANDGTVTVSGLTAPGANFWYSIIYAKQNESASPFSDANNLPVLAFVTGAAAAIPDLAAAIAAVPAGGLPLAAVLIPSTATTTQSAGVVITQIVPFTALTGGAIWARTTTERGLITGFAPGQVVFLIEDQCYYEWTGLIWAICMGATSFGTVSNDGNATISASKVQRSYDGVVTAAWRQERTNGTTYASALIVGVLPAWARPTSPGPNMYATGTAITYGSGSMQPIYAGSDGVVRLSTASPAGHTIAICNMTFAQL